jgi:DnaJ-class molecular chaperone
MKKTLEAFTNFTGMTVRKNELGAGHVKCQVCQGHGGCVIRVDAYGKGRHQSAFCTQCNGWGWVKENSNDAHCSGHEFVTKNIGNCLHEWTCVKCGEVREVDSSD